MAQIYIFFKLMIQGITNGSKGIKIGKLIINDSRALFQPRLHPQHEPSA